MPAGPFFNVPVHCRYCIVGAFVTLAEDLLLKPNMRYLSAILLVLPLLYAAHFPPLFRRQLPLARLEMPPHEVIHPETLQSLQRLQNDIPKKPHKAEKIEGRLQSKYARLWDKCLQDQLLADHKRVADKIGHRENKIADFLDSIRHLRAKARTRNRINNAQAHVHHLTENIVKERDEFEGHWGRYLRNHRLTSKAVQHPE